MEIVTVLGARPQFVKASVVSAALRKANDVSEFVIHTGQHFDRNMSALFFEQLGLRAADVNLDIHGGNHGEMTGRMLTGIEEILLERQPAAVLVYGDTNSTLAGALAAAKLNIPVAHVEAGLRSFNRAMPEEINRVVTDHLSSILFAPTANAVENLSREGIAPDKVSLAGDVMYDVALHFGKMAASIPNPITGALGLKPRRYALVTIHRAENTDEAARLRNIYNALCEVARELPVVWPLHPRTRAALSASGVGAPPPQLHLVEPCGYLEMINLESAASVIATDSGGVQKEAYFHRVPCVTLRGETEWVELVELGWNRLVDTASVAPIVSAIVGAVGSTGGAAAPYGDGKASTRIAAELAAAAA